MNETIGLSEKDLGQTAAAATESVAPQRSLIDIPFGSQPTPAPSGERATGGEFVMPQGVVTEMEQYDIETTGSLQNKLWTAKIRLGSAATPEARTIEATRIKALEAVLKVRNQEVAVERRQRRTKLLVNVRDFFRANPANFQYPLWSGPEKRAQMDALKADLAAATDWMGNARNPRHTEGEQTAADQTVSDTESPQGFVGEVTEETNSEPAELTSHERMRQQKASAEARLAATAAESAEAQERAAEARQQAALAEQQRGEAIRDMRIADHTAEITAQLVADHPDSLTGSNAKLVYETVASDPGTAHLEMGMRLRIVEGVLNNLADRRAERRAAPPRAQVLATIERAVERVIQNYQGDQNALPQLVDEQVERATAFMSEDVRIEDSQYEQKLAAYNAQDTQNRGEAPEKYMTIPGYNFTQDEVAAVHVKVTEQIAKRQLPTAPETASAPAEVVATATPAEAPQKKRSLWNRLTGR
jgi:hypothetical protein